MLTALRQNFHHLKWILWAVIAIFVLFVFVDWGMGSAGRGGDRRGSRESEDTPIPIAEFQSEYRDAEDRYRQLYGKNFTPRAAEGDEPSRPGPERADRPAASPRGGRPAEAPGDGRRADVEDPRLQGPRRDGRSFSGTGSSSARRAYKRMLASIGRTPEAFEAETREQILLEKLNRFLSDSVFVGDGEVEEDFESRNVKARVEYVLLPPPTELPGSVTDAEAEAYFKANSANYLQGEKRKAKYLLVETAKIRAGIQVSDADVQKDYNANADTYRKGEEIRARHILYKADASTDAAARAKAEAAVRKLKAGADFAALARAESDDPGSKASGGELGVFGRGQMVKEFEDAAFAAEPKQIVGPVKTAFGYHVIQVEEKIPPARPAPLRGVGGHPRAPHGEARGGRGAPPREGSLREDRQDVEAVRRRTPEARDGARDVQRDGVPLADRRRGGPRPEPGVLVRPLRAQAGRGLAAGCDGAGRGAREARRDPAVGGSSLRRGEGAGRGRPDAQEAGGGGGPDAQEGAREGRHSRGHREGPEADRREAGELRQGRTDPGPRGAEGPPRRRVRGESGRGEGARGPRREGAVLIRIVEKTAFDKAAFEAQKEKLRESLRAQKASRLIQALLQRQRAERKIEVNREVLRRFDVRT